MHDLHACAADGGDALPAPSAGEGRAAEGGVPAAPHTHTHAVHVCVDLVVDGGAGAHACAVSLVLQDAQAARAAAPAAPLVPTERGASDACGGEPLAGGGDVGEARSGPAAGPASTPFGAAPAQGPAGAAARERLQRLLSGSSGSVVALDGEAAAGGGGVRGADGGAGVSQLPDMQLADMSHALGESVSQLGGWLWGSSAEAGDAPPAGAAAGASAAAAPPPARAHVPHGMMPFDAAVPDGMMAFDTAVRAARGGERGERGAAGAGATVAAGGVAGAEGGAGCAAAGGAAADAAALREALATREQQLEHQAKHLADLDAAIHALQVRSACAPCTLAAAVPVRRSARLLVRG